MADKDLNAQLKDLRRQLDELVRRQEQDRAARPAAQEAAALGAEGDAKPTSTRPEWPRRLQQQFEELLHHFKTELNEAPAASALTVFALGVLVGRLISK